MGNNQKTLNFNKIGLMFLLIFWSVIAYLFYSYFYQTNGRSPDWAYDTPRPFLAGWSEVSRPLIQDDVVYFCAGYGWWDNEVSLSALRKDGTLVWKTMVQYRCNEMDILHDKIYVGQKYYHINQEKAKSGTPGSGIIWNYRTLVIDPKSGKVIQTFPFEYDYASQNNIYKTASNDNNLRIYDLQGVEVKKIPLLSPSFVTNWQNNRNTPMLLTSDGFWNLNTDKNNISFLSDKGRKIHSYQNSDQYFCYTSYDGKYDIQKKNDGIDAQMSCRRQDNWEKVIEDIPVTFIYCSTFYLDNDTLFMQKNSCNDKEGYIAINLASKEKAFIPSNSNKIPRLISGYNSTPHFYTEPISPKEIIVKNKQSNQEIWRFKSTGNLHGFVEVADAIYIYDDDGKLYMFKKEIED